MLVFKSCQCAHLLLFSVSGKNCNTNAFFFTGKADILVFKWFGTTEKKWLSEIGEIGDGEIQRSLYFSYILCPLFGFCCCLSFIFIDCFLFFKPVLYLIFVFLFYILQTNSKHREDSRFKDDLYAIPREWCMRACTHTLTHTCVHACVRGDHGCISSFIWLWLYADAIMRQLLVHTFSLLQPPLFPLCSAQLWWEMQSLSTPNPDFQTCSDYEQNHQLIHYSPLN